jgi:hypothetical protein
MASSLLVKGFTGVINLLYFCVAVQFLLLQIFKKRKFRKTFFAVIKHKINANQNEHYPKVKYIVHGMKVVTTVV